MMDQPFAAVTLRTEIRTPSSSGRRTRCSIDPAAGTDRLPTSDRQTSVRSSCPSTTTLDRPWPSATPFDEDEPDDVDGGSLEGPEVFAEVVDQPATTSWDWFDEHIRCITTADPREQFVKKRSTDKASDTYKATMQEICGSLERLEIPADSDETLEIPLSAIGDTARDLEVLSRQTSVVETSRAKTHRKVKDFREQPEVSEMRTAASTARWKTESASGMHRNQHHRPHQQHQQQQQLDENAMKRMMLYEKYLERQNAWAEGLTKSGKDILMAIQRRKKRSSRFPVSYSSSSTTDDFRRPRMVRSTTWCSSSNTNSAFRAFAPAAAESSLSCNG